MECETLARVCSAGPKGASLQMEYKDYYRTLGVEKSATTDEVKKAYRKLARKHHPDVNPNDPQAEDRFKEINEAYEVLRDSDKRGKYDRLGANWQRYQQTGGDPGGYDWSQWFSSGGGARPGGQRAHTEYGDLNDLFGQGGFSDFFQTVFGGRSAGGQASWQNGRAMAGRDAELQVEITLEEAFHGATRILQIGERRLEVKIPSGVDTGSRVRIAGEGQPGGQGGSAGDLYLVVQVQPHERYRREGADLRMALPVDLYTMILGGEVVVTTLKGRVSLRIPAGTRTGQTFRLRGQGMPNLKQGEPVGDLYVEAEPVIPADLSEQEKQLYKELAAIRKPA